MAASNAGAMSGLNAASLGLEMGMQVGNFISAYGQSEIADYMQKAQLSMALSKFTHQDNLTDIAKNAEFAKLKMIEGTQSEMAQKTKDYNRANEALVAAQCNLTAVKHEITEKKKTEGMAKINTAQIDKYFCGKPVKAA